MEGQEKINQLFQKAANENPHASFGEVRERFLGSLNSSQSSLSQKKASINLKKLLIMFATVSTLIISITIIFSLNKNESIQDQKSISKIELTDNLVTAKPRANSNQTTTANEASPKQESLANRTLLIPPTPGKATVIEPFEEKFESQVFSDPKQQLPIIEDPYVIPKLTEEEIAENNKQKKSMLKSLEKLDKKVYSYIPSGTFDFKGKTTSVQGFYMQKTEVSNLEYRTFLFDLLIQGKKDEFLKARPDYQQWSVLLKQENSPYEQHYFSHPAYNNYPVVNVSREGAEMYCKWITQEVNKVLESKNKDLINDIRIPVREEWNLAASSGGTKTPYPWGGPFMRNSEGLYLANFKMTKEEYEQMTQAEDNADVLAPVLSYWPNDYGLYNMSGNAAEMVYNDLETKAAGTAGGGWQNTADELKIEADDTFNGITTGSPVIGFRVVMTYLGK